MGKIMIVIIAITGYIICGILVTAFGLAIRYIDDSNNGDVMLALTIVFWPLTLILCSLSFIIEVTRYLASMFKDRFF
jgi:hypothetical protein